MAKQIPQWQADDGTLFPTEAEADEHDAAMADHTRAHAYAASLHDDVKPRARSRVANTVINFLEWERTQAPPE